MPLWIIYHPPTTFTDTEEKFALANEVTKIYTGAGLPAFYVNVLFIPVQPTSYFIGGVARPSPHSSSNEPGPNSEVPWIRVTIENIARKLPNAQYRDSFLSKVDEALKPFIQDKGYDWEYSVVESDRDLWKVQGHVPPMPGSEAEKTWARENRPGVFEREAGGFKL